MIQVNSTVPALERAFRRYDMRNAAAIRVDGVVYLSGLTAVGHDLDRRVNGGR